jgi:hypothetical protein
VQHNTSVSADGRWTDPDCHWWVTNEEKCLFELFPEVLKANVTSQTNKEK